MNKHPIPEEALKKHIAILGMNGSGKTSAAKSQIIEPALARGDRVCCIDPTGVGWGLRLLANGKPGFGIYVVGGERADFPLHRRDGKAWGEIVGTSSDSFVFDTAQMTVEDRSQWFTDFAETLLRKNKGPLNFVLDEAHLFAPQGGAKSGGVAPRMLHATNNLLALGRSRGLRITMISQRPAKLHKDSLTQAHTMIAMMMTSPQDRGAVKDWIADQADPETGREIIASLPVLAPGEGWVWAPREKVLDRVKFTKPKTFDSSCAPDHADGEGPKLAPINPANVTAMLEKVAKDTVSNDPAKLRGEIATLRKELAAKSATAQNATPDPQALADAAAMGYAKGRRHAEASFHAIVEVMVKKSKEFPKILDDLANELIASIQDETLTMVTPRGNGIGVTPPRPPALQASPKSGNGAAQSDLPAPLQRIVDAIRWWNVLGVPEPTQAQVAFVAGYSHKSGTWSTYLGRLRASQHIDGRGELTLTATGQSACNDPSVTPDTAGIHAAVISKIEAPLRRILAPLLVAYPSEMTQQETAEQAGYSPSSGTWSTYLGRLRRLDLIEGRGSLKAQGWLFP